MQNIARDTENALLRATLKLVITEKCVNIHHESVYGKGITNKKLEEISSLLDKAQSVINKGKD
jgi:hypothetical protein